MINILTFILALSCTTEARVVERIVAIVNSEIITLSDIDEFKSKMKKGGLVDDALMKTADLKKLKKSEKEIINYLINERIIDSEIKKQNLQITVERVEQEIRTIAKKNGISRSQLKQALKAQGVNFSEYQNFIKSSLERQSLIEKEVSSKIKISDDDITEYYLANSKDNINDTFYEYSLAQILFLKRNGGPKKSKERADSVLEELESGKPFGEMASQYSEDPNFTQGGILGTFKINELNSTLAKAVKRLKVGEHSKVLRVAGNNYQIIKVTKKRLIPNPKINAQKPKIRNILFEIAFKKQLATWLELRKQLAFIRINK